MIKDNRIIFGYGTVGVRYYFNTIIFEEIDPPQEIGAYSIGDDINHYNPIKIIINPNEYDDLLNELNTINEKENKEIIFKDYILDFNKFNKLSVKVVIAALDRSQFYNILAFAC